jgi:dephospho-CoA kinase
MIIGLTGNIGSGKSTVARQLKNHGAMVIDTDQVARDIVKPGEPALKEIVSHFGAKVLQKDGTLNRRALADIVFKDVNSREKLNNIMHPRILQKVEEAVTRYRQNRGPKAPALVIEAPLLFETGLEKIVDEVWLVTVDMPVQVKRIMQRDNTGEEQARRRISSQMPQAEKIKKSDRIIDNSGSPEMTAKAVSEIWINAVINKRGRKPNI